MYKRSDYMLKNMLTTLGSTINMIGGTLRPLNKHKNFHFDNE